MHVDPAIAGGFLAGVLAGTGARYGRLCTMGAVEDALIGRDYRGARAWTLAAVIAAASTLAVVAAGLVDITASHYAGTRVHLLGLVLGGLLFGLGMALAGTCSFGLLVRAGGGDLRAMVSALVVGIFAFAFTTGSLAPLRSTIVEIGRIDLTPYAGPLLDRMLARQFGEGVGRPLVAIVLVTLGLWSLADARLRRRPRLVLSALAVGLAVTLGWLMTTAAVAELTATRIQSLSFVAPIGRALLQFMMEPFRGTNFGISAVLGVVAASFVVAVLRRELRWEAFDDALEMRRHMLGAALMGIGGVLAQGCTIGQGLSAASTLSLTAPIFILALLAGAFVGLKFLIEGASLWRLGVSPRAD